MEIEKDSVVLEFATGSTEERGTHGFIRYEDDVISEYVRAVLKSIYISDLKRSVLSNPKCTFIIS